MTGRNLVSWVRSQLLWKSLVLYGSLSLLALTGLLLALNHRVGSQTDQFLETSVQVQLARLSDALTMSPVPREVALRWRDSLATMQYRLMILDETARSLIPEPSQLPVIGGEQNIGDPRSLNAGPDPGGVANVIGAEKRWSAESLTLTEPVLISIVQSTIRLERSVRWLTDPKTSHRILIVSRELRHVGEVARTDATQELPPHTVSMLMVDATEFAQGHQTIADAAGQAAIFTWISGIFCTAVIISGIAASLQSVRTSLGLEVSRDRRHDILLRVSERNDELGQVARELTRLDDTRRAQLNQLSSADQRSRSALEMLSAVLDSMIEGVIAVDQEERILFMNTAARRLFTISERMTVGRRIYEAIRIPAVLDTISEVLKKNEPQTLEFRVPRETQYLSMVASPVQKNPLYGAVIVVRDVSEVRRLESMRRDFVSGVSHELKTPLTVIQACTDTLLDGAVDDPDASKRFLTQISEQSERLLELILGMLQLARVESGAEIFHIETVDAADVVHDVVTTFQTVADSRGVALETNCRSNICLQTDIHAIRTIVSNLIDNAIKHTPEGGVVTVETDENADGRHLIVRDTGVGIAAEHQSRIFERFYRVERDRSRELGGTGLGLAIVKHLCLTMGARVTLRSELGKGTEFRVTFPNPEHSGPGLLSVESSAS